ncbi:RSC complex protein [Roridomyces roridus]|uniref:RSC complex protein n=1 Tax=Roridomyces roridus TaxID=1738132 RepID=A0AAD7B4Y4_9AGAR|nr:RSC complex protein [Roridomyces roridus]
MKRALRIGNGTDAEAARAKRRKEMGSSSDVDITADPAAEEARAYSAQVYEHGIKLWQTIKDATAKDGRALSTVFHRKPSKKLYPDYYVFITHPIALDDIKHNLDTNVYPTLEAVRQDLQLCFDNAKTYNMEGSEIWKDAKDLLKLTNKTFHKLAPSEEDGDNATKKPSLHRLCKSRLQKLIDKTDDNGRILSDIFMELPSKKDWPSYYIQIKRPQCLEAILKRLKRKEYITSTDFADDVELVFSNAMEFNLEHTQIWDDAVNLRDAFRQLMSDLPAPFAVPRYQKSSTKIKIKMPAATAAVAGPSSPPPTKPPVVLRVPAKVPTPALAPAPLPAPTPPPPKAASPAVASDVLPPNTLPSSNSIQVSSQFPSIQQQQQPPAPAPIYNASTTTFAAQSAAAYKPGGATFLPIATPTPVPITAPTPAPPPPPVAVPPPAKIVSVASSPAPPPIHPSHMLKGVSLMTEPCKRPLILDHQDGVKTWVMRLGPGEHALSVADVTYMGDEESDSSESELSEEEEEEDDDEMDVDGPVKNGKKKAPAAAKGKLRNRAVKGKAASAAVKALQAARAAKKEAKKIGEVQVKLNGLVIAEKTDRPGSWLVDLQPGSNNVLEVGEKGGLVWKVYATRA